MNRWLGPFIMGFLVAYIGLWLIGLALFFRYWAGR